MLLNIIHHHLAGWRRHGQDCTPARCERGCAVAEFTDWLEQPVTAADRAADQRIQQQLRAINRAPTS